ncbi:MAG TPA: ABC transporter permease [Bryobacteraceae bacterium]|jgi:predicted permease
MSYLRFVRRTVSRNRSFTLAVVSLLAVGIGVTTLMFSAVDAVLLRPLPVLHPEQLVRFVQHVPRQGTVSSVPLPVYEAIQDRPTSFLAVLGEHLEMITMTDPAPAERIRINLSTPNFFDALGVHAELGRTFVDDDATDNSGDPPAILSHGFWQRRFNGDPKALGRKIRLEDHVFVIVGILPREFNGLAADSAPDVRLPLRVWPLLAPGWAGHPENVLLELAGRLKPSVSVARARTEVRTIWDAAFADLHERMPNNVSYRSAYPLDLDSLENGTSILRDRYAAALKFLIACSALLLLMVCASVSGLLLAEAAVRQQEFAVRLAIGATRVRVAKQALAESAVMAAFGAIGGVTLAVLLVPLLSHLLPVIHDMQTNRLTLSLNIGVDRRVLLFSVALSFSSTLLFGLAPAITGSRTSLDSILRATHSRRTRRGRQALLLIQVAMCTSLLTGTALLLRTLEDLHNLDPGFDSTRVISYTIGIPNLYHPGMPIEAFQKKATSFFDSLQERILETPGVESVGLAARGVMRERGFGATVARVGERPSQEDFLAVSVNDVSPSYFQTLGIRLLSGRLFRGSSYDQSKPQQVIVNDAFAQRFFRGLNPLGRRFGRASPGQLAGPDAEIIGVVSDAKYRSLREPIRPILYEPFQKVEGTL